MSFPTTWHPRIASTIAVLIALGSSSTALAQFNRPDDGWYVRLGTLGMAMPEYEGSDQYQVRPVPDVEITYDNRVFLSRQGLGVNLVANDDLTFGVAIAYDGGRKSSKDDALTGYRSVGNTAVGRVFAEYHIDRWMLSADVTTDLLGDGHKGTTATIGSMYMFTPGGDNVVLIGPSLTWASDDYMNSFFSTTSDRFVTNDPTVSLKLGSRSGYKAKAGFKDAGLTAITIHQLNDHWSATGFAAYSRLLGDAADSPFVKDNGSRNQFMGGMGISYTF